ncbi:MAG TPA: heme ABC exporter ATP-binding protein CcmA [Alphaproteobacteria bacterium]|nr:heme ABC exporter ATP-binding protein CcmA [Alphaproteobacteria bacterium]
MSRFTGSGIACRRGHRVVFSGLDFTVETGGALVLVGPNGSGKSSLLRLMAGLLAPFAGKLAWDGLPVADDPGAHRARIAYLGHLDAIKPMLSVRESIGFWADLRDRAAWVQPAMDVLGLADLADLPARFLSAGQRRRLALARVIAMAPPLWLLDEPTVGLDTRSIAALETALAAHRRTGGIVVAATHAPILLPDAGRLDLAEFALPQSALAEAL